MAHMGVMEKKMETTIVYRDCMGVMENNMETTIYIGLLLRNFN